MSAEFICDGCGKRAPATCGGVGNNDVLKPRGWYARSDEDGRQDACSRTCVEVVAKKTGKTGVVLPL
ncbi:MAG TPA: hypothetical protein VMI75_05335 [Polyangiaceae bacterium]|nr:hypothetical protein [Polyangiaceae bacterium]